MSDLTVEVTRCGKPVTDLQPYLGSFGHLVAAAKAQAEKEGRTVVAVGWDGKARGVLMVADTVKRTSAEAISRLKQPGLTPVLLTGDNEAVARQIAAEVGIEEVIAEVLRWAPALGIRLQRRRDPGRSPRPAQPDARRRRYGPVEGTRYDATFSKTLVRNSAIFSTVGLTYCGLS